MEPVLKIASYISNRYFREFGENIEEMKLHQLLYFAQRESLIRRDEPLFPELFEARRFGPVILPVRTFVQNFGKLPHLGDYRLPEKYMPVMDSIFKDYAHKEVLSLSRISHGEYSWQNARRGLAPFDTCNNHMRIEDIRRDADRIIIRRYLSKFKKTETQILRSPIYN